MLRPYLKIWDWDLIFGRAVKAISLPVVRSPWSCQPKKYFQIRNHKYFDSIVHQHSRKFDTTSSFPLKGKEHLHNPIKLKNEIGPASKRDRFQFPELQSNTYSAISQYFFFCSQSHQRSILQEQCTFQPIFSNFSCMFLNSNNFFQFEF